MQNKVSIVIPVYNGARVIERLVTSINSQLSSLNYEIILVNDGSSDDSDKVCSDIASHDPKVKFIDLSRNFGEHNAVMAGLNNAKGDFAIIIDDDLQHPFNSIIAPRPIGWISSKSLSGQVNLAPYSFFNAFNYHPPIIGFSSIGYKDSVKNAADTGEFCWSLVTRSLAESMNHTSTAVDSEIDEFELANNA